jgi:hypothetical protein
MEENNTKIVDRLSYFIDSQGENFYRLSKNIGVSNSYFNKMTKNKGSIGADIVQKIVLFYENLNIDWLITGRGNMLRNGDINGDVNQINGYNNTTSGSSSISGNVINKSKVSVNSNLQQVIAEKDRIIEKQQEQIDSLIGIINNLTNNKK